MLNRSGLWVATALLILPLLELPGEAAVVRQLTDLRTGISGPGALDDAGSVVFSGSSTDQFGANPTHAYQIIRWDPVTGAGTPITSQPRGVSPAVSVSDDGQWLALVSPGDLIGSNHDLSAELFVMRRDGTAVTQLTNESAVNGGSVAAAVLSGNGNLIAFLANTDPLGTNSSHQTQLFVIRRDGTGLLQLTSTTTGSFGGVEISDDGTRIVFIHTADLVGTNADLSSELFAINGDGTGLRQLTAQSGFSISNPSLAGGGTRIAFQSDADLVLGQNPNHRDEIFAIDWVGTGLRQVTHTTALIGTPAAQFPSITDDGQSIVFHSNHVAGFTNIDSNYEIWRIRFDGTGLRALTSTAISVGCVLPKIAGGGGRVAFYSLATLTGGSNPDGNPELNVIDGNGGAIRQLSNTTYGFVNTPEITADGRRVVFNSDGNLLGGDGDRGGELYRIDPDGGAVVQLTTLSSGGADNPAIADDGQLIVFDADANPTGGNLDASRELFSIRADGTNIRQLTSGGLGRSSQRARIAGGGSLIVFESDDNPLGGNADNSTEIFAIKPDGTGLRQLTTAPAGKSCAAPRVDRSGTWIVFESNADLLGTNTDGFYEIFRIRGDGTGLQQLTSDALQAARAPDVSADGRWVVFQSRANPVGNNADGTSEIFALDTQSQTLRQLTVQSLGASSVPRLAGNGQWVYFASNAPLAESDPDEPADLYRATVTGGVIERVGALRAGSGGACSVSDDGARAVFAGLGDLTEANADLFPEAFLIDRTRAAAIRISKSAPTIVDWDHESGPLRYDVIRGSVANLAPAGPTAVSLGAVVCLENDSPEASTRGFGDAATPPAGQAFFFVYRGSEGLNNGPGAWGQSSDGRDRQVASGSCPP